MFVDSDDAITSTALEELYSIAKNFDADVVYCEKFYKTEIGEKFTTNIKFLRESNRGHLNPEEFVKKPTPMPKDIDKRLESFGRKKFWTACWNYLFNHNLIRQENIRFPLVYIGEDEIFDLQCICLSKNVIRVPNKIYIWRTHEKAFSRELLSTEKYIERWVSTIFQGIPLIDEFIDKLHIGLKSNNYKHLIFESFITEKRVDILNSMYAQIPAWQLDEFIRRELEKVKDKTSLTAFLFSRMNVFNVNLNRQYAMLYQMNAHIQKQNEVIKNLQAEVNRLQQK